MHGRAGSLSVDRRAVIDVSGLTEIWKTKRRVDDVNRGNQSNDAAIEICLAEVVIRVGAANLSCADSGFCGTHSAK